MMSPVCMLPLGLVGEEPPAFPAVVVACVRVGVESLLVVWMGTGVGVGSDWVGVSSPVLLGEAA